MAMEVGRIQDSGGRVAAAEGSKLGKMSVVGSQGGCDRSLTGRGRDGGAHVGPQRGDQVRKRGLN